MFKLVERMINVIGIKICRWALVQIYCRDVGVCCQSWGRQGRSFATNTLGEAINLHQCSVAGLNGYYSAFEWLQIILQLCGNDTKIMFISGCSAWIWSRPRSLILDLVPAPCCEPGPLWSHRNSFSLYIVCFPSLCIFIAMRYNSCSLYPCVYKSGKFPNNLYLEICPCPGNSCLSDLYQYDNLVSSNLSS